MKYRLEITVFVCGAVVMVLEIVGSRVLAPYLGTSIVVWTSLIGIILASLSYGYWLGGCVADKGPSYKEFSLLIFMAAVFTGITALCKSIILALLDRGLRGIYLGSMLATMILFAPPSILLGMVSPYAVKLKIKELAKSGSTVGNLYAISTIGSIAGTFVSGFILISYLGNTKILLLLSITLAIASLILHSKGSPKIKIYIILFFIFGFFGIGYLDKICSSKELIFSVDTQYQGIRIYESVDGKTKRPIRYLVTSFSPFLMLSRIWQSAMFVDGDDLYVAYTKFYDLARHFKPDFKHSLMIGGGGYSYPKHYLKKFSDARIDVVEIDPKITDVAMKYFNLEKDPRLTVYHEDGRTFLNKTKNKYDVICIDVFWWFAPPFHLATKEAAQRMRDLLADDGVVLINIVSAAQGKKGKFLRAEYATFKEVFAQVYLFPVQNSKNSLVMQNIMLVALKSEKRPLFKNNDKELNEYLMHIWDKELESDVPVLTDDYAPVENYVLAELG